MKTITSEGSARRQWGSEVVPDKADEIENSRLYVTTVSAAVCLRKVRCAPT